MDRLELGASPIGVLCLASLAAMFMLGTLAVPLIAPIGVAGTLICGLAAAARARRKLVIDGGGITEFRLLGESHIAWDRVDSYAQHANDQLEVESKWPRATIRIDARYVQSQQAVRRVMAEIDARIDGGAEVHVLKRLTSSIAPARLIERR